jgi:nucleotide-binding universal stress UspA family protein
MFAINRILYPTDFSSYSNQAYFHAVALAETHGASLTILYVFNPAWEDNDERDLVAEKEHWREQLEQIRPTNSRIPVRHVLIQGDPQVEIAQFAAKNKMDIVVMGTHGRTGRERMLMGSVAEQTLRNAPCSVLVVKMPKGVPPKENGGRKMAGSSL